ncbi:MAG: aldolase/citrate lyase family protein [Alphaproteobacteria bacterium]|jgi:4-hydroxy-2-oxoheptanedioate aldolase|nr:aldolase/citrate lyase family protein [Alphaproteobacteria bacterium]
MRENAIKTKLAAGGTVVNGWLSIANSFSAEVMAAEDFDSVTVDLQHGMVDFQAAVSMLQAISSRPPTPLARAPWNDPSPIMKLLDAGAYGIICPMINNAEECERFVGACRYAPRGYRSFGPPRGLLWGGADYAQHANDTILTFAMIETRESLDNLDAIMSVEELDGIYIGPSDLAISLGHLPSGVPQAPDVIEAIDTILAAAKRNDVIPGIHCATGQMARDMFDKGFQLCTLSNDARMLGSMAQAEIKAARGED